MDNIQTTMIPETWTRLKHLMLTPLSGRSGITQRRYKGEAWHSQNDQYKVMGKLLNAKCLTCLPESHHRAQLGTI